MISIVTDSSAHLTRAEAQALGVTLVPMTYSSGPLPYTESYIDQCGQFERLVAENMDRMRTSQATFSAFMSTFDDLAATGDEILCLTMSSRLSGTYGNARMAAQETAPERIQVVDSLTTSGGLYLMILEARKLIDRGLSLEAIARELCAMRGRVKIIFSVDDIQPLRRSGRLGGVRLSISTILNIRPLLQCIDGCIVSTGTVRGRNEQLRTLFQSVPAGQTACVVEGFLADEQVSALKQRLESAGHAVMRRAIGPVLGIHLGVGCVGAAWIESEGNSSN